MITNDLSNGPWETVAGPDECLSVCGPGGGDIIADIVSGSVADRNVMAAAWSYHMAACQLLPWLHQLPPNAAEAVQALLDAYNAAMSGVQVDHAFEAECDDPNHDEYHGQPPHAHQWNDDDYCSICGADGRA